MFLNFLTNGNLNKAAFVSYSVLNLSVSTCVFIIPDYPELTT